MGSGDMKTVPVGVVSDLIRADLYFWGSLMAAGLLGSVPVAIAYAFLVDHYVSGSPQARQRGNATAPGQSERWAMGAWGELAQPHVRLVVGCATFSSPGTGFAPVCFGG